MLRDVGNLAAIPEQRLAAVERLDGGDQISCLRPTQGEERSRVPQFPNPLKAAGRGVGLREKCFRCGHRLRAAVAGFGKVSHREKTIGFDLEDFAPLDQERRSGEEFERALAAIAEFLQVLMLTELQQFQVGIGGKLFHARAQLHLRPSGRSRARASWYNGSAS